jgi:hypothetical protein
MPAVHLDESDDLMMPSSLLHLWIFCIFMQKIPIIGAALAVCKVEKFTFVNF